VNYTNGQYTSDGVSDLLPGETGLSWTYWALNPGGDTGGILMDDWTTPIEEKLRYIRKAMAPLLPTYDPPIPGLGVNFSVNSTSLVPQPTHQATMAPSAASFSSYHTRGHQIVDQHGKSVRLAGLNW
jgi:hypothetical protein